jgi:hypothetical protein
MFDYPTELEMYSTDAEYRRCIRSLIKDKNKEISHSEVGFDRRRPRRDHNERRAGLRRDFGE